MAEMFATLGGVSVNMSRPYNIAALLLPAGAGCGAQRLSGRGRDHRPAGQGRCQARQLAMKAPATAGAGGNTVVISELRNRSAAACILSGYPDPRLLGRSRKPILVHLAMGYGFIIHHAAQTVVVPPHRRSAFELQYQDIPSAGHSLPHVVRDVAILLPPGRTPAVSSAARTGTLVAYGNDLVVSGFYRRIP